MENPPSQSGGAHISITWWPSICVPHVTDAKTGYKRLSLFPLSVSRVQHTSAYMFV